MLELLAFTPCDKILIDEGGNPSLIVLIENIEVQVPEGSTVPAKVIIPKEWAVFTLWKKDPNDPVKHYKQICELVPPGNFGEAGSLRIQAEFDFTQRLHRTVLRAVGFPVGVKGTASLNVWLEENGKRATETFSYPLNIVHKTMPASSPDGVSNEANAIN
jgi:hypothetical protein